jgi:hypothetical protein
VLITDSLDMEPALTRPCTLRPEPIRVNARKDTDDPSDAKSNVLSVFKELVEREKLLKENVEPIDV